LYEVLPGVVEEFDFNAERWYSPSSQRALLRTRKAVTESSRRAMISEPPGGARRQQASNSLVSRGQETEY
jgi:hypothetical protein